MNNYTDGIVWSDEEQAWVFEAADVSKSSLNALLAVLSGTKQKTEADRIALLELAVKVGVCCLYEHYKEDVLNTFSLSELTEIADTTHRFRSFTVEHIYKTALSS